MQPDNRWTIRFSTQDEMNECRDLLSAISRMMRQSIGRTLHHIVSAFAAATCREHALEIAVSRYIRAMPFLWIAINDPPGPGSERAFIERNSIALLSNYSDPPLDRSSGLWLGDHCNRQRVRRSGLWNNNHVDEGYNSGFLEVLAKHVASTHK
jgi:hypothetical protein